MTNKASYAIAKIRQQRIVHHSDVQPNKVGYVPHLLYVKCHACGELSHSEDIEKHLKVCPRCGFYFPLTAKERIKQVVDNDTFLSFAIEHTTSDPLHFPGYKEKVTHLQKKLKQSEAVVTGTAAIRNIQCVLCVMDSHFFIGSMGSVVGERIASAIEYATVHALPVVIFTASGGARMQEGILSLLQMAKTAATLAKHQQSGLLYISVITHPTTGGVSASFAMLGDIILAESKSLIGFAGPRVIAQTIDEKLPADFQTVEFMQDNGFIDCVLPRHKIREAVGQLLSLHQKGVGEDE